jgi:hypothetical protein
MAIMPGGSLVDVGWLEAERARGQAQQKSLDAQAASRAADIAADIAIAEQSAAERQQARQAELPPHLRDLGL